MGDPIAAQNLYESLKQFISQPATGHSYYDASRIFSPRSRL
jgi:hypothetical protein